MKFKEVHVFSSDEHPVKAPLIFYRDPESLYIWFSKTHSYVMSPFGWKVWSPGTTIGEIHDCSLEKYNG